MVVALRLAGCVFAEEEAALLVAAAADGSALTELVQRRVGGEPLEQILGWAEFCGLRIPVRPGVFVPRRRTELVVRTAVPLLGPAATVVDLCCGTGAIGAALLTARPDIKLYAADLDPPEVACARATLEPLGGIVHAGDLFEALPPELRGRIDVLVANAPYVPSDAIATMPSEAREHEHRISLDGGSDGLDVQRRILGEIGRWLAADGAVVIETSRAQGPATAALFRAAGLTASVVHDPNLDGTAVSGRRTGS